MQEYLRVREKPRRAPVYMGMQLLWRDFLTARRRLKRLPEEERKKREGVARTINSCAIPTFYIRMTARVRFFTLKFQT
jgi:hypothetical protein